MIQNSPDKVRLHHVSRQARYGTLRSVSALMLREMSSTYGRSPGGYLWAILEPLLGIALLTIIFSIGFRSPRLGDNFPIFYATGLLPFLMFMTVSNKMGQAINYSKQLLAYPRVTFVDTLIARMLLAVLTSLIVSALIFTGILLAFETRTTLVLPQILLAFSMAAALGIGIGTLNCLLVSMYPVWQQAWSIFTRPLFLVSGVIFIYEAVPMPYQDWIWYNPLMHVTGVMRAAFYFSYEAVYVSLVYVFGISFATAALGLVLLSRFHRDIREL
ncbi:MAG: ABC transporter permease [Pseudomonadota bacterium]